MKCETRTCMKKATHKILTTNLMTYILCDKCLSEYDKFAKDNNIKFTKIQIE
jgi:Zn finger protein HypA/HybF involved in hydrogenase expression